MLINLRIVKVGDSIPTRSTFYRGTNMLKYDLAYMENIGAPSEFNITLEHITKLGTHISVTPPIQKWEDILPHAEDMFRRYVDE